MFAYQKAYALDRGKIKCLANSGNCKDMPPDALGSFCAKIYNTKVRDRDQAWHKLYTVTDSPESLQAIAMEL